MPIQCDDCHPVSFEETVVRVKVFAALLAHFFVYDLMRFGSVLACDLYRLSMLVWCAVRAVLQVAACYVTTNQGGGILAVSVTLSLFAITYGDVRILRRVSASLSWLRHALRAVIRVIA
jgi:hypothetical protein